MKPPILILIIVASLVSTFVTYPLAYMAGQRDGYVAATEPPVVSGANVAVELVIPSEPLVPVTQREGR